MTITATALDAMRRILKMGKWKPIRHMVGILNVARRKY